VVFFAAQSSDQIQLRRLPQHLPGQPLPVTAGQLRLLLEGIQKNISRIVASAMTNGSHHSRKCYQLQMIYLHLSMMSGTRKKAIWRSQNSESALMSLTWRQSFTHCDVTTTSPLDQDGNLVEPKNLLAFLEKYEWDMPNCLCAIRDNGVPKMTKFYVPASKKSGDNFADLCLVCRDASCPYFSMYFTFLSLINMF
jgi:hypothetical protein